MIKCHWTAGLLCSILPDKTGKMSFLISQHFFSLPGSKKNAVPTKVELMRINRSKQKNTLNHSCCLCILYTRPSSPLFFFILFLNIYFFISHYPVTGFVLFHMITFCAHSLSLCCVTDNCIMCVYACVRVCGCLY